MKKETVLITGGSGFLGRNLAIKLKDKYNVILGARNNGNNQLAQVKTGCRVAPLDITNSQSINDVLNEYRPDMIIHAAATKFVDISEEYPMECIDVNILGSQLLARIAMEKGIKKIVGVSTDKAAPPVGNIYGHSKAVMERMFCALDAKSQTRFVCTRFGNISWSTGSVFPIWKRMTEQEGMIGSTGPHMRRFFFSVEEASDLVIEAMENIETLHGGILSLQMKSAQVRDFLDVWSEYYKVPWKQIDGRPGDKLDEVLIGRIEIPHTKELEMNGKNYFYINYRKKFENDLKDEVSSLNAARLSKQELQHIIVNQPKV
ncbi:SDR family NAD(P)-dependent oxidoreductase [Niabella aurantiaca]|uniref:SDR family NAD(P)-dependent oxidoreductase n=1 Tax=Niabella aurantiaca TaxID=379900 RepID=UPI00035EF566|nr:SDR family NAD(P)-dependent oxidoreductase [Niabella aurantiaca]